MFVMPHHQVTGAKKHGVVVFFGPTVNHVRPRDDHALRVVQDDDRLAEERGEFGKDPGVDHSIQPFPRLMACSRK